MKATNELVYRGILCKQVDSDVWGIVIGQNEYLYPTFEDAKCAINTLHEECSKNCFGVQLVNGSGVKRKKSGYVVLIICVAVFLFFFFLAAGSDSTDTPKATKSPVPAVATSTATPTVKPTAKPTEAPTNTPTPTPHPTDGENTFTVEHDEEYYATQDYIYKFLTDKGYEVDTFLTVPNIGRIEDDDPDDLTVPWYAIVKHNGEWTQFTVLLFNGEVTFIRPTK